MENTQTSSKSSKIKLDFKDSKYATGRRKTSIAPVLGKSYRYSVSCNFSFTAKAKNLLHKMSKNEN